MEVPEREKHKPEQYCLFGGCFFSSASPAQGEEGETSEEALVSFRAIQFFNFKAIEVSGSSFSQVF